MSQSNWPKLSDLPTLVEEGHLAPFKVATLSSQVAIPKPSKNFQVGLTMCPTKKDPIFIKTSDNGTIWKVDETHYSGADYAYTPKDVEGQTLMGQDSKYWLGKLEQEVKAHSLTNSVHVAPSRKIVYCHYGLEWLLLDNKDKILARIRYEDLKDIAGYKNKLRFAGNILSRANTVVLTHPNQFFTGFICYKKMMEMSLKGGP